jgi:hypothetical protein
MVLIDAAAWGLAGGLAAALISVSASIAEAKYRRPWSKNKEQMWARLIVGAIGLALGALVAGANHNQLAGEWPALIMGASAPSVIRGMLGRIEVTEQKPAA